MADYRGWQASVSFTERGLGGWGKKARNFQDSLRLSICARMRLPYLKVLETSDVALLWFNTCISIRG